jgi:VanZ family protein
VHAGLFGILSYLFSYPLLAYQTLSGKTKRYWLIIAIACCVWGLVTEFIQLFVPGRDFDWLDWAADSAGVVCSYVYLLYRKKKS